MGVKGLWQLLECVGRPITLESLDNKVLGVDASLILNQSVKGLRDKIGNPVYNAHLVGLFSRLCKLLYYRIKPVFVFDGGVPNLKKKTLAARKERRFKAIHGSSKAAEKIVKNYLKAKALETVTGRKSAVVPRSKSPREPDVFELPPLPSTSSAANEGFSEEDDIPILDQFRSQQMEQTYQDPATINIDSQDFKSLPAEIQHELIKEVKEERKWRNKHDMPRQSRDFSCFQLDRVLKRGKMNQRLDELCKEMNSKNSGDLLEMTSQDSLGENSDVKSQKILSEDSAHYILIKSTGNSQGNEKDQEEEGLSSNKDFSREGGFFRDGEDCKIISWTNPLPKTTVTVKPPCFDIPDLSASDSEMLSPLVDKPSKDIFMKSPTQTNTTAFDFSSIKEDEAISKIGLNVDEKVERESDAPKLQKQNTDNNEMLNRKEMEELQMDNICNQQEGISQEGNKNDSLLTEIITKKKELEDLIKKWEVSNKSKTPISLTASTLDEDDGTEESVITPLQSSQDRQQEFKIEGEETNPTVLIIGDDNVDEEKTEGYVCVLENDSDEGSSVEEMAASLEPSKSDIGSKDEVSGSGIQQTVSSSQEESMLIDGEENAAIETTEIKVVSSNAVMNTELTDNATVASTEQNVNPSCSQEVIDSIEIQVSSDESGIGTTVDEQEAGPSGVPVEWQEATTVENLKEIQMNIETEQKSLATEKARQNRIAATVSNEMFTECQELLQLFGVPFLVSPMEAEAQCAALDVLGLTDGSITDDSDIFLFGGTRIYKNIFNQNKHAELYRSDAVQRDLALDRSSLICIAFVTGSDYTEGIQGVGPVGAMEILQEFPGEGLEGLKKFKSWHKETQEQTKIPQETKVKRKMRSVVLPRDFPSEEVFEAYLHPVVDESTEQFEWGKPDLHSLRLFASDKLGWSTARTDEILLPVLKQLNKDEAQMKIDSYFQVAFDEKRSIKSKRIRQVLNRTFNPIEKESSENQSKEETSNQDEASKRVTRQRKRPLATEKEAEKSQEKNDSVKKPKLLEKEKGGGAGAHLKGKELMVEITPLQLPCSSGKGLNSSKKDAERKLVATRKTRATRKLDLTSQIAVNKRKDYSTSDSSDSDGCDDVIYERYERPVQGFRSIRTPGRPVQEDTSTSDSSDDESNVENAYQGPKPVPIFHRGRSRGRGSKVGRGDKGKSVVKVENRDVDCDDDGIKSASVIKRRKNRGRGKRGRR
ncbi:DNA excision repair protein ERCC-5-like isoform X2 [Acropora millepora]|uniref:DNA excision repair protein ERCC-5-like isoform X2 n=1 Tax=Acropora millepora TaxID=45264 RepID=UPI001CF2B24A|nr:DNA excision repair protein ERCC-5-like isoform X2 [Acropora millepora]